MILQVNFFFYLGKPGELNLSMFIGELVNSVAIFLIHSYIQD